jgi:hypothetical protein
MDMLYLALFPTRSGNSWNDELLQRLPSRLTELLPAAQRWSEVIRVIDFGRDGARPLWLNANALKQQVVCYLG